MQIKSFRNTFCGLLVCFGLLPTAFAVDFLSGDFQQILNARSGKTVVWQFAPNPAVYIYDFQGLLSQGRTFNRITQFTEQQGTVPYPRVLSNDELQRYITASKRSEADFAFGHDVLVWELVQFFNFASRDQIELNPEEVELRNFLIEQGLMRQWRGFYQAMKPDVVVLAVPQTQAKSGTEPMVTDDARFAILLHEMSHAEYYTNPHYAKYCQRFWNEKLSDEQRAAFTRFLGAYNYDVNNGELLVNESQAYLMFTPDVRSFSARRLGVSDAELANLRATFKRGMPPIALPTVQ